MKAIAMMGVLLIHSNLRDGGIGTTGVLNNFQHIMCLIFPMASVPVFFCLSGYFLFNKYNYLDKLKTRFKSLVVPFVVWCLIGLAIVYMLQVVLGLESMFANSKTKLIKDFTFVDYIRSFWDIRDGSFPITSPLWYLRDLIVLVAMSPIVKWCVDRIGWLFVGVVFVLAFFGLHIGPLSISSLLYFALSATCMIKGTDDFSRIGGGKILYISIVLLIASCLCYIMQWNTLRDSFSLLYAVSCIPSLYYICSYKNIRESQLLQKITGASFFIYLFHEPWLGYLQKACYRFVHLPEWTACFMLFVFPIIILMTGYLFYSFLKRYMPKTLSMLTGSR